MTKKTAKGKRVSLGAQIIRGLEEAVVFERGELSDVRVRRVALTARKATATPAPSYDKNRIAELRSRMRLSQPVFADVLNVSTETVRAWEQGKRVPDGAALRLLELAEEHPTWLVTKVRERAVANARKRG